MKISKNIIDLTGKEFGRLVVIKATTFPETGRLGWLCRCKCGKEKIIVGGSLKRGATVSCGCRMRETFTARIIANTTHGAAAHGGTRTFHSWNQMKGRCYNANNRAYKDYGGRGITVCQRWLDGFLNFLEDMGECPPGKSIDRYPDKNGNYEKSNCRWATPKEQANNRRKRSVQNRNAHRIECRGEIKTAKDWKSTTGIKVATIRYRLRHGRSAEQALGFVQKFHYHHSS
jgi:hypothetical protein